MIATVLFAVSALASQLPEASHTAIIREEANVDECVASIMDAGATPLDILRSIGVVTFYASTDVQVRAVRRLACVETVEVNGTKHTQ